MSQLSRVPPEILRNVFEWLNGTDLVRLWLTGDTTLLHTIGKRGAVTTATFHLPSGDCGTSRLPGMLTSFIHLTTLEIHAHRVRIAHPERMWRVISSLKSLLKLSLRCSTAEEWMFEADEDLSSLFAVFDAEDLVTAPSASDLQYTKLRPIASALPCLESLLLETKKHFLRPEHLALLPKSLTSFSYPEPGYIDYHSIHLFAFFPNIREINLPTHGVGHLCVFEGVLPPTVTYLAVPGSVVQIPSSFWGSNHQITTFKAHSIDQASFDGLPSSLETLDLDQPLTGFHYHEHLSKVTDLSVGGWAELNDNNDRKPSLLPNGLKKLTIDCYTTQLELPAHLESLDMNVVTVKQTMEDVLRLKSLTSLTIHYQKMDVKLEHFSALPPGLTDLTLFRPSRGSILSLELNPVVAELPRGITALKLAVYLYITSSFLEHLPRQLTSLHFGLILEAPIGEPEAMGPHIGGLPRNLVSLTITHVGRAQDAAESHGLPKLTRLQPEAVVWSSDMVDHLPKRMLRSLSIVGAEGTKWSDELMKRLDGEKIEILTLNRSELLFSAFPHLPKGLKKLIAQGKTRYSSSSFKFLPRTLNYLYMPDLDQVYDQDLGDLPRGLRYLTLAHTLPHVTKESEKVLPQSIVFVASGTLATAFNTRTNRATNAPLQDPDPRVRLI